MDMWARLKQPPNLRLRLKILAIGWVVIGGFGACLAGLALVPDLRAAHGDGVTGRFTLTEPQTCDRYEPPRQRCGWFGDFLGEDGRTVRRHMDLNGGLPPGARVGDTVAARDAGSPAAVYPVEGSDAWRLTAGVFAGFSGAFVVGLVLLLPRSWRRWSWRRRSG
jgi:hypothetical protein